MMATHTLHWENLPASTLEKTTHLMQSWDRLNAERGNLPFMAANAIASALRIFGNGSERLLVAKEANDIVAMLLVVKAGAFQWRTFQPSQLPLGTWVASAKLTPTDITRSIIRGPLGFCLTFSLTQIDPLLAPKLPDALDIKQIDYIDTGWIEVTGTFEEYWANRGKNLRQNMRKQRSKLAADGITTSLRILRAPDDMPNAIARYGILESSGWKAGQGTAIHPENSQGKFYIELLKSLAQQDEAIVYEYLFNEKIVATNLCIRRNEKLVILKTTYDESIKNFSPAFLLSQDATEHIFKENIIKKIEYYGRMMEWHTRWTENKRPLHHLTNYRWPWLKKIVAHRHKS